jgi:hypothetical protein
MVMALQLNKFVIPALLCAGAVYTSSIIPTNIVSHALPFGYAYAMGHLARDSLKLILSASENSDLKGLFNGALGLSGFAICTSLFTMSATMFNQRFGLQAPINNLATLTSACLGFATLQNQIKLPELNKLVVPALLCAGAVYGSSFISNNIVSSALPFGFAYAMGHLAKDSLSLILSASDNGNLKGLFNGALGLSGFAICTSLFTMSATMFNQRFGLQTPINNLATLASACLGFVMQSDQINPGSHRHR